MNTRYIGESESDVWEIKPSDIQGLGLFAKIDIAVGVNLGKSHVLRNNLAISITEMGIYHNHSYNPNATSVNIDECLHLVTVKPISAGDEITVNYRDYVDVKNLESDNFEYDDGRS